MGLKPTGSRDGDLKLIDEALAKKANPTENSGVPAKSAQKPSPQTPPAVASFMQKLGLSPTNSKEGDHAAITAKLAEISGKAQTPTEKMQVDSLNSEFQAIIASVNGAGADQMAAINKAFFLNGG